MKKEKVLVSSCLLGIACRYDAQRLPTPLTLDPDVEYIPVCPEQLGGMPTPRPPCVIASGDGSDVLAGRSRVLELESGTDKTDHFLRGAEETLRIARVTEVQRALLKQRSPSCGVGRIYHGKTVVPGNGVTAALLKQHGIEVESEE